jgi:cell division protein FtsA
MFHLPARVAVPRGLERMPEQLIRPEYATVVGLLLYGARARRQAPQRPATFVGKLKSMFAGA